MLTDFLSKAAILALAAVVSATPVSVEAHEIEAREHDDFKDQMIAGHNWYRNQHSAQPLEWDETLAINAQAWASKNLKPNNAYGENLAWGFPWSTSYGWVNAWGRERVDYDWANPGFTMHTGHFSQLVWKRTTHVGCAWASCPFGFNIACEYNPGGNMLGSFPENVAPQTQGDPKDEYSP